MSILFADLRYALRQLRRTPGFALTAMLTLTLGIGANVVVFGVLEALLVRSLPVPQAQQLSFIQHREDGNLNLSFPQYKDLRQRSHAFAGLAAYRFVQVGLAIEGKPVAHWVYEATGSYFDTLGVQPYLGRFFRDADDTHGPNGSPYVVLSYALWKNSFAGDPAVVGRTIRLSQQPFTVLGVAPPDFQGTERFLRPALWVDMWNQQQIEGYSFLGNRHDSGIWVLGRRRPGISVAAAQADLNRIAGALAHTYPSSDGGLVFRLTPLGLLGAFFATPMHGFLDGLMLLAALVLLAACANLGGLYAARAADRTREISIRIALGSSRIRIARQLITESLLLALLGGTAGCLLARFLLHVISRYRPPFDFPVAVAVDPGAPVFLFAVALSLLTGLLCGFIPAREAARTDVQQAIKSAGAIGALGRRWSLRDLLLLAEVMLCCVLVTASFVSLRGLARSLHAPLGFQPANVTIASFDLSLVHASDPDILSLHRAILTQAERLPGVTSAAYSSAVPLSLVGTSDTAVYPAGTTDFRPAHRAFSAQYFSISPRYFETAGTPLLAGRDFAWSDDAHAPAVAIVNQNFARQLFGNVPALGKTFVSMDSKTYRIVGIVADGKYGSLNEDPSPALFFSAPQHPQSFTELLVRTRQPAALEFPHLAAALTDIVHRVDPDLPISNLATWQQDLGPVLFPARAATIALGILGALALMLAVTGIFGLASYSVTRRMRDFGIRLALGSPRADILRVALGRVARLVFAGSLAGVALGLAATRVLAAIVYGATAADPIVLLAVCVTMIVVGVLSAAIPARRVLAADPAVLLRDD